MGWSSMNANRKQLDPLESVLLELKDAEQANLFARTPVDPAALLRGSVCEAPRLVRPGLLRWVSAAAVIGLAVGLWQLTPNGGTGLPLGPNQIASVSAPAGGDAMARGDFLLCFSGPRSAAGQEGVCESHDFDADGDVDLADFQAYQLAYAGPHHKTR